MKLKIACIGDIHGFWEESDSEFFNHSDYDFLLLTGDLPDHKPFGRGRKELHRKLNLLRKPSYMSLGNWDGANYLQLIGEVFQIQWMIRMGSIGHLKRVSKLKKELSNVQIGAYDFFPIECGDHKNHKSRIGLLIGRPFSCGGENPGFIFSLRKLFGIKSMQDSVAYYKKLIDSCKGHFDTLIILSHNGPTGLGDKASDIYGCDFRKEEGDWGDPDLEEAIRYAKSQGLKIPLVVSGHMHHRNPKTKSKRKWLVAHNGTVYLNSAKVPRNGSHFSVLWDDERLNVELNR